MKISALLSTVALVAACGTQSSDKSAEKKNTVSVAEVAQFAEATATKPVDMPASLIVRVKENGLGDVLTGAENVEIRSLAQDVSNISSEELVTKFATEGASVNMAANEDSLDGDSSQGQHYWHRPGYGGYCGYNGYYWNWNNYGYTYYRPTYLWNSYSYGYNYRGWWSWGGYRYYRYCW